MSLNTLTNDPNADWFDQNAPAAAAPAGNTPLASAADLRAIGWSDTDIAAYYAKFGFGGGPAAPVAAATPTASDDALRAIGWSDTDIAAYRARYPDPTKTPATPPPSSGGTPSTPAPSIGVPTTGFGAAPPTYASNPNAPVYQPVPDYVPPTWTGGDFAAPTKDDLLASPGYQSGLDAGLQARNRSAAAQGTVLNGGTLKGLTRYGSDYAQNSYQTLYNNSFDAYKQRYSQFTDAAGQSLAARTINANQANTTFQNNTAAYLSGNSRTLTDYLTNNTATRNSELDYWNRLQDLNQTGANLAGGSR